MTARDHKILILGIGNEILKDDGIGIKLCRDMEQHFSHKAATFLTTSLGGLEILDIIQDFNTVVFIDAIKTSGGTPGDVYVYTPSDFSETLHLSNLHDINFLNALELGRTLGMKIPDKMLILAVEIKDDIEFGEMFSPQVAARYDEIRNRIAESIAAVFD